MQRASLAAAAAVARCRNCQSDKLHEDDEGQVVCDACGTIFQHRKQIAAMLDVESEGPINLKLARRTAPKQNSIRIKSEETLQQEEKEKARKRDQFNQTLRDLFPKLRDAFQNKIGVLHLDEHTANMGLDSIIAHPSAMLRSQMEISLLYDCTEDPFLLASDVISFSTSGVLPVMQHGICMERGPSLFRMHSLLDRAVNWKAVAMRMSIKFAQVLRMDWFELWRAVYLVLFAMDGHRAVNSLHGFGLPTAVMACVVLVRGWDTLVFDLVSTRKHEFDGFRFVPLDGKLSRPTPNLMDRMEHSKEERERHYKRQNLAMDGLNVEPNRFLKRIFETRTGGKKDEEEEAKPHEYCDGKCLHKLPLPRDDDDNGGNKKRRREPLQPPEWGLNVWFNLKWYTDQLETDDMNQALVHLIDLTSTALDRGLGLLVSTQASQTPQARKMNLKSKPRKHHLTPDRHQIKDELYNLCTFVHSSQCVKFGHLLGIHDFLADTQELLDLGCQRILICARNVPKLREQQLLDAETTDEE